MCIDPDEILNMDQTPFLFTYHWNQTLEKRGSKTIHVLSSMMDTTYTMLEASVTACVNAVHVNFYGKTDGRIGKIEMSKFQLYPAEHFMLVSQSLDGQENDASLDWQNVDPLKVDKGSSHCVVASPWFLFGPQDGDYWQPHPAIGCWSTTYPWQMHIFVSAFRLQHQLFHQEENDGTMGGIHVWWWWGWGLSSKDTIMTVSGRIDHQDVQVQEYQLWDGPECLED